MFCKDVTHHYKIIDENAKFLHFEWESLHFELTKHHSFEERNGINSGIETAVLFLVLIQLQPLGCSYSDNLFEGIVKGNT